MNTIYRLMSKHLWMGLGLLCATFVGTFFITAAQPASAAKPDEKLVSIYDNNSDKSVQTIATSAKTVREALIRAKVEITSQDSIEPGLDTPLISGSYSVNIYRARPVTIVDGGSRIHTVSPYQSPSKIATGANITTYPEDILQTDRIDDVVSDNALGLKVTIKRAKVFDFNLYGNQLIGRTQAKTVGDMLHDKGVVLGKDDGVSLPLDTQVTANMNVRVWRNGVQTITQNEPVPFTTRKIQAPDQLVGYSLVQAPGANGAQSVTYQINMQNGLEVSRQKIQAVVTTPAVEEVKVVGTKATNTFSGDFAGALARLRSCEAGGVYSRNSGNGYYGAYQYNISTWANYQGFQLASDAPPAVQDEKAWITYQARGWQPWPSCTSKMGLQDIYR